MVHVLPHVTQNALLLDLPHNALTFRPGSVLDVRPSKVGFVPRVRGIDTRDEILKTCEGGRRMAGNLP